MMTLISVIPLAVHYVTGTWAFCSYEAVLMTPFNVLWHHISHFKDQEAHVVILRIAEQNYCISSILERVCSPRENLCPRESTLKMTEATVLKIMQPSLAPSMMEEHSNVLSLQEIPQQSSASSNAANICLFFHYFRVAMAIITNYKLYKTLEITVGSISRFLLWGILIVLLTTKMLWTTRIHTCLWCCN